MMWQDTVGSKMWEVQTTEGMGKNMGKVTARTECEVYTRGKQNLIK
jgi:hypothetical protein